MLLLPHSSSFPQSSAPRKASASPAVITLPFEYEKGLIFLSLDLNGVPRVFLFDTGCNLGVLDKHSAEEAGLTIEQVTRVKEELSTSKVEGGGWRVRNLKLRAGDFEVEKDYLLFDLSAMNRTLPKPVFGIVGSALFLRGSMEIDYRSKTLTMNREWRCSAPAACEDIRIDPKLLPIVKLVIAAPDGRRVEGKFELDTGDNSWVSLQKRFDEHHERLLIGRTPAKNGDVFTGMNGDTCSYDDGHLTAIWFGSLKIDSPKASSMKCSTGASSCKCWDGTIGNKLLEHFRIGLDYPHGLIHLEILPEQEKK